MSRKIPDRADLQSVPAKNVLTDLKEKNPVLLL